MVKEDKVPEVNIPDGPVLNLIEFHHSFPIALITPRYNYSSPDGGFTGLDFGLPKTISLIRFLPTLTVTEAMLGGRFEGSNKSQAIGYEEIHTITVIPHIGWNNIILETKKSYRYVRYVGAPGTHCIVSKIEYYTSKPNPSKNNTFLIAKLKGTPFGASPPSPGYDNYDKVYSESPDALLSFKKYALESEYPVLVRTSSGNKSFFHQHDFYELIYVKTGSCFHLRQNQLTYLFAGDFIMIPPETNHIYFGGANTFLVNIMIYLELLPNRLLHEISNLNGFQDLFTGKACFRLKTEDSVKIHLPIVHQKEVLPLLETMVEEFHSQPPGYRCQGYSLLLNLLVRLSRYLDEDQKYPDHHEALRKYKQVEEVISYLEQNYTSHKNLEEVLALLQISYSRLAAIFKQETGLSIYDYLARIRIGHACRMLIESDTDITKIAYNIGFQNYNNFARIFKHLVGCPPLEFRNHYRPYPLLFEEA